MKRLLLLFLFVAFAGSAQAQIRINEVGYAGVDIQGSAKWVELYNAGDADVDVSDYWLCNFPAYSQISGLTVLDGAMMIPAGGYLVVAFDAVGADDGEVGLYASNEFGNSDAMLDYVQYGAAGHTRETVAVGAGVWTAGTFATAPMMGETLSFLGTGSTPAESWVVASPSPGASNGADHTTAMRASIDRFSMDAGHLFIRDETNGLPEANSAIDFDMAPFITQGFGPSGDIIRYYNFDVQPTAPAPIYVLFREGEDAPVAGQYNIVDVIPGDENYNDFWQPVKVTVPANYVANAITSAAALTEAGYTMEPLDVIVNCPIVPEGSAAAARLNAQNGSGLVNGWYKDEAVFYFEFGEAALAPESGSVPVSPIYVTFNINPDQPDGGPPSGFKTEEGSAQTHNVVATLPGDEGYSPLWVVNIYDNAEFDLVSDLASAEGATILAPGAALVNCPVVAVEGDVAIEKLPGETPTHFALQGNFPNPFNPTTTIRYDLSVGGQVELAVFNMLGQQVAELVSAPQAAGAYQVQWDGRDSQGQVVASGVYLYRVTFNGNASQSRVMTLLK
ncbi:MAG: FlgD immunoglobulin-like domain containing protein [Rhodothermales bacterium]